MTFPPEATAKRDSVSWFFQKKEKVIPEEEGTVTHKEMENHYHMPKNSSLTLRTTQGRVADAGVLVVSKVKKGSTVISIKIYTLVNHSFNNIYTQTHTHKQTSINLHEKTSGVEVRVYRGLNKKCYSCFLMTPS